MKMKIFLVVFLLFITFIAQASPIEIAITIDDLPKHMDLPPDTTRLDVAKKMLSSLKKHSLYNVYGFINAGNIKNDANHYDVLKIWVDSGQLLGNHTYDHVNFNTVNSQQFIRQIKMNESYLSTLMQNKDYRYFRYPYLYEGNTQEKRDAVREYLFTNHYKVAQVTMDFEDYLWNNAYIRCVKKKNNKSIEWLKESYIEQALKSIEVAHIQSNLIFKRDIKQVLLLHIGVFDALMLDDLLTTFERHQIKFISLPEALQDKAYQINPNIVSKNTGGFLDQMMLAKKIQPPNFVKNFIANIPEKKIDNLCR